MPSVVSTLMVAPMTAEAAKVNILFLYTPLARDSSDAAAGEDGGCAEAAAEPPPPPLLAPPPPPW